MLTHGTWWGRVEHVRHEVGNRTRDDYFAFLSIKKQQVGNLPLIMIRS